MTETPTPVEEQPSAIQAGDLGKKLVACREKAGLDLEQTADELHLSVSLLRSLEEEAFERLPEPPYVRGYLRGYAKLSDTDPKEIIRIYEVLRGANPDEIAHHFAPSHSSYRETQQPWISHTTVKWLGLGVIVLALGMLSQVPSVRDWASSTWETFSAQTAPQPVVRPAPALETFINQKNAEEQAQIATAATTATTDNTPTPPQRDVTPAIASTPGTAESTTAATAEKTTAPEATNTPPTATTDTPATSAPTDSTTVSTATPTATSDTSTTTTNATDTTASTTPKAAAETAADATTSTPPIAGEVNIKLEFTEDVWMQIKDGGKKTLYESLNSAGSIKELKATTPLNFKVGNAHGVKIYLNGQLYDQAPYTKGSVSRFKVE